MSKNGEQIRDKILKVIFGALHLQVNPMICSITANSIANELGMSVDEVLKHLESLNKEGQINLEPRANEYIANLNSTQLQLYQKKLEDNGVAVPRQPMSILSAYNPLKTIWLPGSEAEISQPKGIIVVVGPNSSGKTLFLRDIDNYLLTGNPNFVVCHNLAAQMPDNYQGLVKELIANKSFRPASSDLHPAQYRRFDAFLKSELTKEDNNRRSVTMSLPMLEREYNNFNSERNGKNPSWFNSIGFALVARLDLEERRRICDKVASFDSRYYPPDVPIQALSLNSEAQDKLAEETGNVFGNAVWLDISEKDTLQLRVAGTPNRPPTGEMNNPLKERKYRIIENEGDGYRSYVGTCLSLLVGIRPVVLIDEPELCLHPPQAYHIGKFIGKYAKEDHVTFVATHSSHVIRGLLETNKQITFIHLTRRNRRFAGRLLNKQELLESVRNPKVRGEAILDGIFSKGVVLVEGAGDREMYQAASEALPAYQSREVHFVSVEGTGGFAKPLQFYRSLGIPTAVIADLDAVCDTDKIKTIANVLGSNADDKLKKEAVESLQKVANEIKSLPATLTVGEAREQLKKISEDLSENSLNWENNEDNSLRSSLNELAERLKRNRRLKKGGIESYKDKPEIHSHLIEVINKFAELGLFFVPVGELENWVKHLMEDHPKSSGTSKTERAAIAAERIREAKDKSGDIWEFVEKVLDYLQAQEEQQ